MSDDLQQLIEEATRMEIDVAKIYLGFHHRFHEDADFWWKLAIEEEDHAALLLSGKQYFLDVGMFPRELVDNSLATLKNLNRELECIIRYEEESPLSRAAAFNLAVKLEESAGEVHFQHAMHETEHPSEALKLFQSLNEADVDHADRIRNYMRKNGIGETQVGCNLACLCEATDDQHNPLCDCAIGYKRGVLHH